MFKSRPGSLLGDLGIVPPANTPDLTPRGKNTTDFDSKVSDSTLLTPAMPKTEPAVQFKRSTSVPNKEAFELPPLFPDEIPGGFNTPTPVTTSTRPKLFEKSLPSLITDLKEPNSQADNSGTSQVSLAQILTPIPKTGQSTYKASPTEVFESSLTSSLNRSLASFKNNFVKELNTTIRRSDSKTDASFIDDYIEKIVEDVLVAIDTPMGETLAKEESLPDKISSFIVESTRPVQKMFYDMESRKTMVKERRFESLNQVSSILAQLKNTLKSNVSKAVTELNEELVTSTSRKERLSITSRSLERKLKALKLRQNDLGVRLNRTLLEADTIDRSLKQLESYRDEYENTIENQKEETEEQMKKEAEALSNMLETVVAEGSSADEVSELLERLSKSFALEADEFERSVSFKKPSPLPEPPKRQSMTPKIDHTRQMLEMRRLREREMREVHEQMRSMTEEDSSLLIG